MFSKTGLFVFLLLFLFSLFSFLLSFPAFASPSWSVLGKPGEQIFNLIAHPKKLGILFASSKGGLLKSKDGGYSFEAIAFPKKQVVKASLDPNDPKILYAFVSENSLDTLYSSSDSGKNFKKLITLPSSSSVNQMIVHQKDSKVIYLRDNKYQIYFSKNQGQSFEKGYIFNNIIKAMVVDNENPNRLIIGARYATLYPSGMYVDKIYESLDYGTSFNKTLLIATSSGNGILDVAVDPFNSNKIMTTVSFGTPQTNSILVSTDSGKIWKNVCCYNNIQRIYFDPFLKDHLFFIFDDYFQLAKTLKTPIRESFNGGLTDNLISGSGDFNKDINTFFFSQLPVANNSVRSDLFVASSSSYLVNRYGDPYPKYLGGPPSFHPIVFIHGLNGHFSEWDEAGNKAVYKQKIKEILGIKDEDFSYPDNWLYSYSYGTRTKGKNPGSYNSDGDIAEISKDLPSIVKQLSDQHKEAGGDGRVDLVGYSLGGLIIRNYLARNPTNHNIRKVVTIGTPHKGVWLMATDKNIRAIPAVGKLTENILATYFLTLTDVIFGAKIDQNSEAVQQLDPKAKFIADINSVPKDVEFTSIYGDINADLKRKLFNFTLAKKVSIGDGAILTDSAVDIPTGKEKIKTLAVSEQAEFKFELKKQAGLYALDLKIPNLNSIGILHPFLPNNQKVISKVVCELVDNQTDNCN